MSAALVGAALKVVGKIYIGTRLDHLNSLFQLLDDPIYFVAEPIFVFPPMNGTNASGIVIEPSAFW